jgi:hypothetical protein|tara:strand:- start:646 stop:789 length:144 start_codon:yes stop_codon:yes gene_type:complete
MLEGKETVVGSTKDLKPESFIAFSLIILIPLKGKNPVPFEKAARKQN